LAEGIHSDLYKICRVPSRLPKHAPEACAHLSLKQHCVHPGNSRPSPLGWHPTCFHTTTTNYAHAVLWPGSDTHQGNTRHSHKACSGTYTRTCFNTDTHTHTSSSHKSTPWGGLMCEMGQGVPWESVTGRGERQRSVQTAAVGLHQGVPCLCVRGVVHVIRGGKKGCIRAQTCQMLRPSLHAKT